MKEDKISDNHQGNYTKTIILLRLSEYCRIIVKYIAVFPLI